MNNSSALADRAVIAVSGPDARNFLQGLITNDVKRLTPERILYAALLTPQGKILFDFFLHERNSEVLLDCAADCAEALHKRLSLYRLRAKVDIGTRNDLAVVASWGSPPLGGHARPDPRLAAMGWRSIAETKVTGSADAAYTMHRLKLGVPEGRDFGQDAMFALDAGLEELNGVSFDKGCYVGQELTARMKHRGTARKRLVPVRTNGASLPQAGTAISATGQTIGAITSTYGDRGFALVRLDRLAEMEGQALEAQGIPVLVTRPLLIAS